jgi:hypothetical protein
VRGIYKGIAASAEAKNPPTAKPDAGTLEKKFSQPGEKAGYRKYFQECLEKGKTAESVLAEWLNEFPNANPNVERLMREVATEFA